MASAFGPLCDHLGSTAVTANASGAKTGELRYYPYGSTRTTWGTTPTTYRFTGQREERTIGLYFYNARYYDPVLGRFVQADTIVPEPGNPSHGDFLRSQSLNRYAYVLNNALRYTDPTGHNAACAPLMGGGPLGAFAALVCEVGYAAVSYWPQIQALAVEAAQFAASPQGQLALQYAQQADAAARQAFSSAGNTADPGGLGPNDPFRGLPEAAQRGIQRLQQLTHHPIQRFARGYQAQLARAEHWAQQGQLTGIEETGPGGVRYDLVLKGENTIVEVKYWTAKYAMNQDNLASLARQLKTYQAQGKQIILEMFQTATDPLTQAQWQDILLALQREGINLSRHSQLLPPIQ